MPRFEIINREVVEWASAYDGPRFHALFCDSPYGLEFMNKDWDSPHKLLEGSQDRPASWLPSGNLGGFADGNKPSFARQGNVGAKYQEWCRKWGEALLPLFHPGGLAFCFGGTRMWEWLATGMQLGGWEHWDTAFFLWTYGQGFPKAQDVSKLIDRMNGTEREVVGTHDPRGDYDGKIRESEAMNTNWRMAEGRKDVRNLAAQVISLPTETSSPWSGHKTCALKPAAEPIMCFKAPMGGSNYAELATKHGSGCLNIDRARIGYQSEKDSAGATPQGECTARPGRLPGQAQEGGERTAFERPGQAGRYPANLILECTCGETKLVNAPVCGSVTGEEPSQRMGESGIYGESDSRPSFQAYRGKAVVHTNPDCPAAMMDAQSGLREGCQPHRVRSNVPEYEGWGSVTRRKGEVVGYEGKGGASRFFYTSKASRAERSLGLPEGSKNRHPTVKPVRLCRYLATLLLPPPSVPGRRILVPFSGSGSEMIGCLLAGWDEVVGVEQDANYCEMARLRCEATLRGEYDSFIK